MGSLCSKESNAINYDAPNHNKEKQEQRKYSVQMVAPSQVVTVKISKDDHHPKNEGSVRPKPKAPLAVNNSVVPRSSNVMDNTKTRMIERQQNDHHQRSVDSSRVEGMNRIGSMPYSAKSEQVAAGWPSWLTLVAGEAIKGWTPRWTDSYQKLSKIGQGTYSSVYMARDLTNNKTVAMKKVRFVNMDPDSVRFMAREICILRRLDHPNVMKLEALVTSKVSENLYLVFEYMEHDLAGLLASPKIDKFTEPQIKCFMKQILRGLEHCHNRGILHRDIKGANLLVDNKGNLKIADFGLANFYKPNQKQPLTSRVVTLWYRAPELLLGATAYGPAIDLWSVGCILAELFAGKPIMPGRTEVEQMHKIFKLCGSPSEEFWRKTKYPHASSFKSQNVYKRSVSDAFREFPTSALVLLEVLLSIDPGERGTASSALKSVFFTSKPLPCDPSSIPKYPPSKELDARRHRNESVKGRETEYANNNVIKQKIAPQTQEQSNRSPAYKLNPQMHIGTGFPVEHPRGNVKSGLNYSSSMIHPNAVQTRSSSQHSHGSQGCQLLQNSSNYRPQGYGMSSNNDLVGYAPKNRILLSGPLMPPGGDMDDMLKEHERQIQETVRKARKSRSRPE